MVKGHSYQWWNIGWNERLLNVATIHSSVIGCERAYNSRSQYDVFGTIYYINICQSQDSQYVKIIIQFNTKQYNTNSLFPCFHMKHTYIHTCMHASIHTYKKS